MKRSRASDVCVDRRIAKRECYRDMLRSIPNAMKRKRTEEHTPQPVPLEKPFYSKLEVQQMLEDVERRYTQQMESYCTALRDLCIPQTVNDDSHMTYIS
jgi:hypothetical protein